MARVIFLTPEIDRATGIVRVVNMWANYLSKEHDVTVVATKIENPYYKFDDRVTIRRYSFDFKHRGVGIIYNLQQLFRYIISLKQREEINLIVDKSLLIEPLWILRKIGLFRDINLIYFTHSGSSAFREFYLSRRYTRHRVSMMFNTFDRVVCLFDDEKSYPSMVQKDRLFFLSNPIPFELSYIDMNKKENIVLYLGRIRVEKGIDTLLKAWALVDHIGWRLEIVGDGRERDEFKLLAKELKISDSVEFIASQSDVRKYYNRSKIFVLASIYEGMPMTILEAMACKSTVVSSDTAGGLMLIENNKTGILFKKRDEEELAKKLTYLMRDRHQRENLANSAYSYIHKYTIDSISTSWSDILV
jgi:glycosyltransferase involved in cell wall biosynthesis